MRRITGLLLAVSVGSILFCGCSDDSVAPLPTTGTIEVIVHPADELHLWSLQLPDQTSISGYRDTTLVDRQPGDYSITWATSASWISSPGTEYLRLEAGQTATFLGEYSNEFSSAATRDELLARYEAINELRDPVSLGVLLHEDFQFHISPGVLTDWADSENPITSQTFSRSEMITMMENLLGGEEGIRPSGQSLGVVQSLDVGYFENRGWTSLAPEYSQYASFDNVSQASVDVMMSFECSENQYWLKVQQRIVFIVAYNEGIWELVAMVPLVPQVPGASKAIESVSYDALLAHFR